ncbi:MAG: hypothetical protein SPF22_07640 [Candidatus Onthovivens sp.]|nr:hypothetical protein [Candidatus Onthovivens sp.]
MHYIFKNDNLNESLTYLINSIVDTCVSEVERINAISENYRKTPHLIIIHKIKNLKIWKELGISLQYSSDNNFTRYSIDYWLERLVKNLVKTKKVTNTASEYVKLKKVNDQDSKIAYSLEDGTRLILDLKSIPEDNKYILMEYTKVVYNKNYNRNDIFREMLDVNLSDHYNFCLDFYLFFTYGTIIKEYGSKISDELEKMRKSNSKIFTYEQKQIIATNLNYINKIIMEDIRKANLNKNDEKTKSYIAELKRAYERFLDWYVFDKKPSYIDIKIDDNLNIYFNINIYYAFVFKSGNECEDLPKLGD